MNQILDLKIPVRE
jgi:hypothetical protein